MRSLIILFLSLILYISMANAKQKVDSTSVKQLVQKVKTSTGDDRRVAMNTLKVKLRSMNQETRQHVMRDLQKSFSGSQHGRQGTSMKRSSQRSMHTGNTGSMQQSGGMQTSPSRTPGHYSPTTSPHTPTPSTPHYQPAPSTPQTPHYQPAPSGPQQAPHMQPSSPQMPSPGIPSPHFGQPGGHK